MSCPCRACADGQDCPNPGSEAYQLRYKETRRILSGLTEGQWDLHWKAAMGFSSLGVWPFLAAAIRDEVAEREAKRKADAEKAAEEKRKIEEVHRAVKKRESDLEGYRAHARRCTDSVAEVYKAELASRRVARASEEYAAFRKGMAGLSDLAVGRMAGNSATPVQIRAWEDERAERKEKARKAEEAKAEADRFIAKSEERIAATCREHAERLDLAVLEQMVDRLDKGTSEWHPNGLQAKAYRAELKARKEKEAADVKAAADAWRELAEKSAALLKADEEKAAAKKAARAAAEKGAVSARSVSVTIGFVGHDFLWTVARMREGKLVKRGRYVFRIIDNDVVYTHHTALDLDQQNWLRWHGWLDDIEATDWVLA